MTLYAKPINHYFHIAEITKLVEEVIKGDNLVISLNHIKPRRRARTTIETLFAVNFPNSDQKFSILLDRHNKRGKLQIII